MSLSISARRHVLTAIFLLVPIINYLPYALGWGQSRFEDDFQTPVDAADYAFGIWGVVFTGMILFSLFQYQGVRDSIPLGKAYTFLSIAGIASIAFVPISYSNNQVLSMLDVLLHLVALIAGVRALRAHRAQGSIENSWVYFAPSVYLGWISAATVIAVTLGLKDMGIEIDPSIGQWIAVLLLVVLTAIGIWMSSRSDSVFGVTVVWALIAVGVEQASLPVVRYAAWAGAVLVFVAVVWQLTRGKKAFFYAA